MMLPAQTRRSVLGVALAASLLVTGWVMSRERPEAEVVAPPPPRGGSPERRSEQAATTAGSPGSDLNLERLKRDVPDARGRGPNAFDQRSWYVPPPPSKAAPPPPPSAPPLPFAYLGKVVEEGQTTVFLTRGERAYSVKTGDTLDDTYRVEGIEDRQLVLIYLPLSVRQTLALGDGR